MSAALTLLVGAAGVLAVPLGAVVARLDDDRWAGAVAATLGVHGLATVVLPQLDDRAGGLPAVVGHAVAGVLFVVACAVRAARLRHRGDVLVVVGLLLLAAAHVTAAVAPVGVPVALPVATGLAAVAVVLTGVGVRLRATLARLDEENDARDEELRLAALRRASSAERDHELRNGLAALAGAARLLGSERADRELLETLVASELGRLDDLLRADGPVDAAAAPYDVEPVLGGLVALRRAAGTDARLDVDPGLRALGSPEVLAQVVTNLVANAERHAPGSPLWISGRSRGGRTVVRVRDVGPGVRPGHEDVVFEPGVRDRARGGRGLGLDLCRRLLAQQDGSIAIAPAEPSAPGCDVVVELPAPHALVAASGPAVPGPRRAEPRDDGVAAVPCGAP